MPVNKVTKQLGLRIRAFTGVVVRDLLPAVCPICRALPKPAAEHVCDDCLTALERLARPRCRTCGGALDSALDQCAECLRLAPRPWNHAVSACRFAGLARLTVHRFKYSGETYLAPLLSELMAEDWRLHGAGAVDVLVPVPLHWTKRLTRGYNQAELLGRLLARHLAVPYAQALQRRRRTRQQAMLDFDQRQKNMAGVFAIRRQKAVAGRHVLLIDDVLTTGATLAAASLVLREAGADKVSILTAARG